ncbi:hypothetical protein PHET_10680, partial [Paragonimus heterotremus]
SSAQATAVTIGRHLNTGHLETPGNPTSVLGSTITTPTVASTGPGATGPSAGKRPESGKIQLRDLRNVLSSISLPPKGRYFCLLLGLC